jgi:hypothetical protein
VLYGPSDRASRQLSKPDPVYKHIPNETFYQGFDGNSDILPVWPGTNQYNVIITEETD